MINRTRSAGNKKYIYKLTLCSWNLFMFLQVVGFSSSSLTGDAGTLRKPRRSKKRPKVLSHPSLWTWTRASPGWSSRRPPILRFHHVLESNSHHSSSNSNNHHSNSSSHSSNGPRDDRSRRPAFRRCRHNDSRWKPLAQRLRSAPLTHTNTN